MDGNISIKSTYGQGSSFEVEILQELVDEKQVIALGSNESRFVGIWFDNETKSSSLADKLAAMGVRSEIITDECDFNKYTHLFLEHYRYDKINPDNAPNTRFIVFTKNYIQNSSVPKNVNIVHMPLTSLVVAGLLDEKITISPLGSIDNNQPSELKLNKVDILIVDDNEINLLIAENLFTIYGANVVTAKSGPEALAILEEKKFDMIFMDHMMPEMDGVDTTLLIRKMAGEYFSKLPIIALTANAVGDVKEMFLKNGMNDFLSKPLEIGEIERVLCEWLPVEKWQK